MKIKRHANIDNWSVIKIPVEGQGMQFALVGYVSDHEYLGNQWITTSSLIMLNPAHKIAESRNTHYALKTPAPAFLERLKSLSLTLDDVAFNNKESATGS